jgi:mRNA interferase MazF
MGRILHSIICAPITSTIRGISTEVRVGEEAGLVRPSAANLDHLFLLRRAHLVRRLGAAPAATMTAVCTALAIALDCSD